MTDRRERIATACLAGLVSDAQVLLVSNDSEELAEIAVNMADALITKLDEGKPQAQRVSDLEPPGVMLDVASGAHCTTSGIALAGGGGDDGTSSCTAIGSGGGAGSILSEDQILGLDQVPAGSPSSSVVNAKGRRVAVWMVPDRETVAMFDPDGPFEWWWTQNYDRGCWIKHCNQTQAVYDAIQRFYDGVQAARGGEP